MSRINRRHSFHFLSRVLEGGTGTRGTGGGVSAVVSQSSVVIKSVIMNVLNMSPASLDCGFARLQSERPEHNSADLSPEMISEIIPPDVLLVCRVLLDINSVSQRLWVCSLLDEQIIPLKGYFNHFLLGTTSTEDFHPMPKQWKPLVARDSEVKKHTRPLSFPDVL